ncbi:ras guanine nucleotide exchange factor domain-containing protein [Lentinula aff. lateritia]|uniref:Ras guanine nucleotide exchange factor domain-containing protein n=1 Tax=Lentinula aff. lateritia TaxID=2804960 RepID=A0ACC1UEX3_9AGAR|nr:ras guanine nucleotide exchange factor domain-containing protein [Lentinula aff. lateritia]
MSVATASHSQTIRQSLHLSIEPPSYFSSPTQFSPDSPYTSSSSARPSSGTAGTSPLSSGSDSIIYSVLCMHDFLSDDPTHLSFSRNEILDIFKQEESGWWAAMRRGGDTIGWIPQAFVRPLEEEMAERLLSVREELRIYEYEAEQLYVSAPISQIPYEEPEIFPSLLPQDSMEAGVHQNISDPRRAGRPYPPPSPATPMPQPPLSTLLPKFNTNKPTTTPKEQEPSISPQNRTPSSATRRPLPPLVTLSEDSVRNDPSVSPDSKRRDEKIKKLTGSDDALAFVSAVNPPWYLKPRHANEIHTDAEGKLIFGTRIALVERLVWEIIPSAVLRNNYRRMFLTTFRTFMTPDDLFDMLVDIYRMSYPEILTESEFDEWRDRCLQPTQRQILTVFSMWLKEYRLLEEEPDISRRLNEFLKLITSPSPLAATAQGIIESITRLTFETDPPATSSPTDRRKKHKPVKNDLHSFQPSDVAEQLTLYEFKLYSKITPQDCIAQATHGTKTSGGCTRSREALSAFCATHDKIAAWVTDTVLSSHLVSRRADTVDFWIKVAEASAFKIIQFPSKCRNLNNFASMSAIINALSSTVIHRLDRTWWHVGRKNTFESLLKCNEPSGGFSAYRQLHLHAMESPCVPFIGMYLTELVHIKVQYSDSAGRVSVLQRQRWYDVVMIMLRSQAKPYNITENETMKFIQSNLRGWTTTKDWQAKFWSKSQEVRRLERDNADIRKGLGHSVLIS